MALNDSIRYHKGALFIDALAVESIVSETATPVYIYSLGRVLENYRRLAAAFAPLNAKLHYSVKANGNLGIVSALINAGAGFDCVSGGEILRALTAGATAADIVFAGVGKTEAEIAYALRQGVGWLNVENPGELQHIQAAAEASGREAVQVALRFNPQVAAKTEPAIATGHGAAKFGMTAAFIQRLLARQAAFPRVKIAGIHLHIGSQLGDIAATRSAIKKALELIRPHPHIETINIGGGFPVAYQPGERLPSLRGFARALEPLLRGYRVLLEPGRCIVADAGILVATVLYVKEQAERLFYIVDASMTELLRPALYGAYHEIVPLRQTEASPARAQVVGPVCESTDVLARERLLPRLQAGDRIAILTAGAYGMAMASNYNTRPRPAEILVRGNRWWLGRRRETWADMLQYEEPLGMKKTLSGSKLC